MLPSGNALNVLLLLAVVMCALSVVTSQHKARKLYILLQQEKEHAQQMDVEWGQLQLEQSTWAAPARVEKIAAQQLQMQLPKSGQIQFIRVEPNEHGKDAAPENETSHARSPLPKPLVETTSHSTRLQISAAKSLVIPQAGEGANESQREFHIYGHIDKQP
ncbi:MAG: cell division protein FtsL [Gallionellales bacterium RIFCSPLOWO2_02_FULL_57_47]|nr:MAG: cell division protein FtsL [Gallionellales bacterium RIFCSPLOWO2_02_FULL_57_47]OGT13390.1 MAG: cell division protein FtsL [Gallionellales bacterium RIFCSPHIGHO2_02_FULL_57_16]